MTASARSLRATALLSAVLLVVAAVGGCTQPARELPAKLSHDFTNKPNGPVAETSDSSQVWTQTASRPGAAPTVVDGAFTNADTQPGASANYLTVRLSGPVTHVSGEFDFGPTGTSGQNVTLIASSKNLPGGNDGVGPVSDLVMHIAFTETGWIYSTASGGRGTLTTLKSGEYQNYQPGTALQKVSVVLDAGHHRAVVKGADGGVTEIVDSSIGAVKAPFFTFEVYYGAADTDKRANIRKVAADPLPAPAPTS
jgi:hypothetical protein